MTSENRHVDAVVVGAGPAGLATSRHLSTRGIGHVVLERAEVAATWRTQRWDSFTLVTPTWMIDLPGLDLAGTDPDSFLTGAQLVESLDDYARLIGAPVRTRVEVRGLSRDGDRYRLATTDGDWSARAVVVASGGLRVPRIPPVRLPPGVAGLHAIDYRRPGQLAPGAVLVVGSGQTGTQLADELRRAGRDVHIATSRVGRAPRRYRGRDIQAWLNELGLFDQQRDRVPEAVRRSPQPVASGAHGGQTLALQQLARDGVHLLGRLLGADDGRFLFADDLADNMKAADDFAARVRSDIDGYLAKRGDPLPPVDLDPVERPLGYLPAAPTDVDPAAEGITTVLWCTGMGPDTGWLPDALLDPSGVPLNDRGQMVWPGLHVVGFPWLTHRTSGILRGMAADAALAADRIQAAVR